MWNLPYLDGEERVSVSTKCPNEKKVTEQVAIRVIPVGDDPDPMASLGLAKRLVICQSCGNMRLIN